MSTKPWHTSEIGRGLLTAAVVLAASASLKLLSPALIREDLSRRLLGVLLGGVVVYYSNVIPKTLTPLANRHCSPQSEQSLRRFAGWCLVLGGVGYAGAWLFAPAESTGLVGGGLLGLALLLVLGRYAWSISRRSRA